MVRCTFLLCDQPPVKRTRAVGDRIWWYGCAGHIDAMIDVMYIGHPTGKIEVEAV